MTPDPLRPSPAPVVTQPDYLLWREVDRLDKRIDGALERLNQIDQHGTRGVDALRERVDQLGKDLEQHEQEHQRQATNLRWLIGLAVSAVLAAVVPLYPLLLSGRHP